MTLAERRKQVDEDRHERSPMRDYINAPGRMSKGKPHSRPDTNRVERGPAAESKVALQPLAAAAENPTWVSSWATAYPGMLSIGGQVKLPKRGDSYTGMWLYVLDEGGYPVVQQEIKKSTDDPSGDTPDTGAWCYDWWASNSYPTDQCFWWAGSALGGILEDGKEYYAWVFLNSADGTSSPGGTTSPLVEAFYTPVIPGAQAGICTCYAQAHRAGWTPTITSEAWWTCVTLLAISSSSSFGESWSQMGRRRKTISSLRFSKRTYLILAFSISFTIPMRKALQTI
ncbi:hypothetical protein [Streptomyces fungicidicus]|uniref:hypothetical protein n=1 Tax=Streptomyces fungicidicus TaxID=68203 RepID=UPI00365B07BF